MPVNTDKELLMIETAIEHLIQPLILRLTDNRRSPYLRRFLDTSIEHVIGGLLHILDFNNIRTTQRTISRSIGEVFVDYMCEVDELYEIDREYRDRIREIDKEINRLKKEKGIATTLKQGNYVEYSKLKLIAEMLRRLYLASYDYQNKMVEDRELF